MPWWVPLVFIYCLWIGWECSKERTTSLPIFFIFPIVFISMAFSSLTECARACMVSYTASLVAGVLLGWIITSKTPIKINKADTAITVPGSWQVMILVMALFSTKFTFGYLRALAPTIAQTFQSFQWIIQGLVSGVLLGKAMNFLRRFML